MVSDGDILFNAQGALGRITLNRPQALNALTFPMCASLQKQLSAWAEDSAIASVVIDAVPGRAFCAGGDIRIVSEWGSNGDPRALQFFASEYSLNAFIKRFPKPYVALVDGIVMGGGAGISVHGSHRVVTENALFAMPETAIGFFTDVGGSFFLSRCPGASGTYLGLTGARLKAADMLHAGIATHFVPSTELARIVPSLAAGEAVDDVLRNFGRDPGTPPLTQTRSGIDAAFSAATVEEILARLGEAGSWGAETARLLAARSPTSLKLVRRQLREGQSRDLARCLEMEFQIVAQILKGHDFYEGVRALLIDKDNKPDWRPPRLDLVSEADIDRYFRPSVPPLGL